MEKYRALWERDIIKDETVVFVQEGEKISGRLAFDPSEILRVEDRFGREWKNGVDFEVNGGEVILKNKSLPYFKSEWLKNENVPQDIPNENARYGISGALLMSPAYLRERQVLFTYKKRDGAFVSFLPKQIYLPKTKENLENKKRLKIALFGDSISNAANSSWEMGFDGYEHYFSKVCKKVGEYYDADVSYCNFSRSGYGTVWAKSTVEEKFKDVDVDLVFIAFGMNDAPDGLSVKTFTDNVADIMNRIRALLPDSEFVLVAPPLPNKDCDYVYAGQNKYIDGLNGLQGRGVSVCNCTAISDFLLRRKAYVEISGNNFNHPNDFFYEFYADVYIKLFYKLREE